jgi:voltage-gated potassium channel
VQVFRPRALLSVLVALGVVLAVGTVGFRLILDEPWLEAFYRAVVSSSLTGLDTVPRNDAARLLTIVLVLAGISIFAYVGSLVVEAIARGVLGGLWAERRRRRRIDALRDHIIICGYGRVGRRVAEEFRSSAFDYVVVDLTQEALEAAREHGDLIVEGNGTRDESLEEAGLPYARGLVAASDDDADNLYIVLSARAARPDLMIVARASNADAAKKLKLAGADRVVEPYLAAGRMMANLVLKPQVTAFIDAVTTAAGDELRFEEIEVTATCGQAGRTIRDLEIRRRTGAVVVGIRKRNGAFDTTPSPDAALGEGDIMIAAGTTDELRALEELFAPRQTVAR